MTSQLALQEPQIRRLMGEVSHLWKALQKSSYERRNPEESGSLVAIHAVSARRTAGTEWWNFQIPAMYGVHLFMLVERSAIRDTYGKASGKSIRGSKPWPARPGMLLRLQSAQQANEVTVKAVEVADQAHAQDLRR